MSPATIRIYCNGEPAVAARADVLLAAFPDSRCDGDGYRCVKCGRKVEVAW